MDTTEATGAGLADSVDMQDQDSKQTFDVNNCELKTSQNTCKVEDLIPKEESDGSDEDSDESDQNSDVLDEEDDADYYEEVDDSDADGESDFEFEEVIKTISNIPLAGFEPGTSITDLIGLEPSGGFQENVEDLTKRLLSGETSFRKSASLKEQVQQKEYKLHTYGESSGASDAGKFKMERDDDSGSKGRDTEMISTASGALVRKRRRKNLPLELKGLMGEANVRYARGDRSAAIKICEHIISKVPDAPEPYQTIAVLYTDLGQAEKSLQYALTAAYLGTDNAEEWCRVAEMSLALGNAKQAVECYTKAIRRDINDAEIHLKRAKLLEEMGERKLALKCYMRLLRLLAPDEGPLILQLAKMVAVRYHEDSQWSRGRDAMDVLFSKCPGLISSEEVNLMLDLLINLGEYKQCLQILVQFSQIEVVTETNNETPTPGEPELQVLSCVFPESIELDLLAKLAVVIVHLKAFNLTGELISLLKMKADPETAGDLYLDVAEALIAENRHAEALELTTPLVSGTKYSLPAVWLRHAECLRACKLYQEAADAYKVIVEQAPLHLEARISLSALLNKLGFTDKARSVLTQDPQRDVLDPGLLYKRCQLLKDDEDNVEEYLAVGQLLLSRHCVTIRNREELIVLSRLRRLDKKKLALLEVRKARGEPEEDPGAPAFVDGSNVPSMTEDWNLLYDLCKTCKKMKRYSLFQQLAFSALGSSKFNASATTLKELELLCLHACLLVGDTCAGYNLIREMVMRKPSARIWNLFNQVVQRADHVRHNRFLIRLMMRHMDHEGLLILLANSCLIAGTYKYALSDYMTVFRANPNPLVALLIGITLFQIACQKFSARKNSLVVQGVAFFGHYKQMRGPEGQQEVNYNLGRAFHQLGLLPAAVHHYEKVLEFKSDLNSEYGQLLDLKREAAFNLHLIYLSSDAPDLARHYCHKYVSV